ncbi:MAG: DUF952 domain-containing protein [Candidatus Sericytochromatia bacterium]
MIVHILEKKDWEYAKKENIYNPKSLEIEGFIHCSKVDQIVGVSNLHYKNKKDMLMIVINENLLINKVLYEDLYNEGKSFPHIYGTINIDSIIEVIDFPCNNEGFFELTESNYKYK